MAGRGGRVSARMTQTIAEKDWERVTDPERRHPRLRSEDEVAAEFPDPPRPVRLLHERKGQKFRPHGTDSVGVIVSHPRSRKSVQFFYRHDPDTLHSMPAYEFTNRFARLFESRSRCNRPQGQGVRHIRATPPAALATMRDAA